MVKTNENKTDGVAAPVRRLFKTREVAAMWGVSYLAVKEMVRNGDIRPIVGMGKGWKFDGTEFNAVTLRRL